jgi:hypothetical protein
MGVGAINRARTVGGVNAAPTKGLLYCQIPRLKVWGLVSSLDRNSRLCEENSFGFNDRYICALTGLSLTRKERSTGATDRCPVLAQSCRARSVVLFDEKHFTQTSILV